MGGRTTIKDSLSPLEFTLLEYLARHSPHVCGREDILKALYGEEYYEATDQRLDALLRRLRVALGEAGKQPRYLITRRGAGVQLMRGRLQE